MDSKHRLQLATLIHEALLRRFGSGIDVALMLQRERYALDVVNICLASDDDELADLAKAYVRAAALDVGSAAILEPSAACEPQGRHEAEQAPARPVPLAPLAPFRVRRPVLAMRLRRAAADRTAVNTTY